VIARITHEYYTPLVAEFHGVFILAFESTQYSFYEEMYMNVEMMTTMDTIAVDLFEIEESVIFALGMIPPMKEPDQVLEEFNFPRITDLIHTVASEV
jgi:hypothetical protein